MAVAVDGAGDAYVVGRCAVSTVNDNILVLRLKSSNGQIEWERIIGGPAGERDRGWDVAVGPDGHPVVHGFFGRIDGTADHVTIKLRSSDGAELWRQVHPGAEGNLASRAGWLAVADSGDILLAARTWSTASSYDVVLHRYAALDGAPVWLRQYDAGAAEDARHMALDAAGNILVAGVRSGDFMVLKFDADTGDPVWASGYNGPPGWYDAASCIAEGPGGVVIAAGFSTGSATSWDATAAGFDPADGSLLWDVRYDHQGESDEVKAMAVSSSGDLYLVGYGYSLASDTDMLCLRYLLEVPATVGGWAHAWTWGGISPNPTPGLTELRFEVAESGLLRLDVFDAAGRWIRSLGEGTYAAGTQRLEWDGSGRDGRLVPAGAYWVRLGNSSGGVSRKVVMIR